MELQHFRWVRFFIPDIVCIIPYNSHTADTSLPLALRLALGAIQMKTKLHQAEVVNEPRQSLIFLTDIVRRALFIFRQPPLEGLFCGASTNGKDIIGFQFVPCLRVPRKGLVPVLWHKQMLAIGKFSWWDYYNIRAWKIAKI